MIEASSFVWSVLLLPQLWYTANKQQLGTVAKEAKVKITLHVGPNDHINKKARECSLHHIWVCKLQEDFTHPLDFDHALMTCTHYPATPKSQHSTYTILNYYTDKNVHVYTVPTPSTNTKPGNAS